MTTAKEHGLVQDMPASLADSFFSVHRLIAHVLRAVFPQDLGKLEEAPDQQCGHSGQKLCFV